MDRHNGRVIWLTYEPEGKVEKTLYMVGKGITYDTGGADIKAGGIMAGMSRDKCGAASAAGRYKFKSQYIVTFPISNISIRLSQYPFTAHPNYGICQPTSLTKVVKSMAETCDVTPQKSV